ncbi:MAG: alpha/beta hydrolase [Oscillospiraceae bacterium]|nr:alpha/beta hydrolase [Oscillospiraceae bacterium]
MSFASIMMNYMFAKGDAKRDKAIPIPEGVTECTDIQYYNGSRFLTDVYYPEGTMEALPTIVSIHGGGYVYGSKKIYRRYCMDLARRGFAVVNFNYRLAPKSKFPAPLEDTNRVMEWICANADKYYLSPDKLFIVGDSAGAQLASQYAAIWSNKEYAKLFDFTVPDINIRALGLNCGGYDLTENAKRERKGIQKDYLGNLAPNDPRFDSLGAIGEGFPPAHITSAHNDFLKPAAQPMCDLLKERGLEAECHIYGAEEKKEVAHVFHVNIILDEAKACNDDQTDFFKSKL